MEWGDRISEEEVLANFALAEISSPKWTGFMLRWLTRDQLEYLRATAFDRWSSEMRQLAVMAILRHRAPFLKGILASRPKWIEATASVPEIRNFRTPANVGNEVLASDLKVDPLVRAIRAGARGNPTYAAELAELKRDFDMGLLRGKPILVAVDRAGPFVIIEGTHRLPAIYWRSIESLPCPDTVHVIVGLSTGLPSWYFFPGENGAR